MKILSIQPSVSAIKNTVGNSSGRNLFSKILTPKAAVTESFEVADKPLIANLRAYYKNALAKLNDIYLEKVKDRSYTGTVEHNINAYENLPKAVQDALSPKDVTVDGHIDQETVNKLFNAAKAAGKQGDFSCVPTFWGRPENIAELNPGVSDIMADEISTGIAEHGDIIAEAGEEHITELATETLHESLADGIAETATEIGAETAKEGIIDHIIDTALG